jgi:predicted Zn-dependent protease
MAPFDTLSHIDFAGIMLEAGAKGEAIEFSKFAVTHDPNPRKWYFDTLLDVYRSAGKTRELLALAEAEVHNNPRPPKWWYDILGYAYAATGQEEKAREAYQKLHSLPDPPEQ